MPGFTAPPRHDFAQGVKQVGVKTMLFLSVWPSGVLGTLIELNLGSCVVFFPSYPTVPHAAGPGCELFIMDRRTFKMQIYGQTWRKCVFQTLEPRSCGAGRASALAPCCETRIQLAKSSWGLFCVVGGSAGPFRDALSLSSPKTVEQVG